jgi:hypothetical protein
VQQAAVVVCKASQEMKKALPEQGLGNYSQRFAKRCWNCQYPQGGSQRLVQVAVQIMTCVHSQKQALQNPVQLNRQTTWKSRV